MNRDIFLRKILSENKTIAVYGMSTNPEKPAQNVPVYLLSKGYTIIPINPFADRIIGLKSYPNLKSIPKKIDIVEVFRPSDEALKIVQEAIERKKEKGDIKVVWLQESIINMEAKNLAELYEIKFVQDKCMRKEHKRLFKD